MKYAVEVITEPTLEPLGLSDVTDHLRVTGTSEYLYLQGLIQAARRQVEQVTGRTLMATTFEARFSAWPAGDCLPLPGVPLSSVTSVKWIDSDDAENTMSSSDYIVDAVRQPGVVQLGYGKSWPSGTLQPGLAIRVRYVAGYDDRAAVPATLRHAMLLIVGDFYENREARVVTPGVTVAELGTVDQLLANYRVELNYDYAGW